MCIPSKQGLRVGHGTHPAIIERVSNRRYPLLSRKNKNQLTTHLRCAPHLDRDTSQRIAHTETTLHTRSRETQPFFLKISCLSSL